MRMSSITVTGSRTINLGNYESLKVEGSCTVDLDESDIIDLARQSAIDEIKLQMQEAAKQLQPKK